MQLKDLGTLHTAINELAKFKGLEKVSAPLSTLLENTFAELSDEELLAKLSTLNLSDELKKLVINEVAGKDASELLAASAEKTTLVTSGLGLSVKGLSASLKGLFFQLKALVIAHPIAAGLAVLGSVIIGVGKAYGLFTTSIEEQREQAEKLENAKASYRETTSALASVSSELDNNIKALEELEAIGNKTYIEESQLENLKAATQELQIQKDILEHKKKSDEKNQAEEAAKQFQMENPTPFDPELIQEYAQNGGQDLVESEDVLFLLAGRQRYTDLYNTALASGNTEDLEQYNQYIDKANIGLQNQIRHLSELRATMAPYYAELMQSEKELSPQEQKLLNTYEEISSQIKFIYSLLDPNKWNAMQLDSIFSTEGIEKTEEELVNASRKDRVWNLDIYPNLKNAVENSDFINPDGKPVSQIFLEQIWKKADNISEELSGKNKKLMTSFSLSEEQTKSIRDLQDAFQSLDEVMEKLNNKNLSSSEAAAVLMDLAKKYPELLSSMDLAKDGYGGVVNKIEELKSKKLDDLLLEFHKLANTADGPAKQSITNLIRLVQALDQGTFTEISQSVERAIGESELLLNDYESLNNAIRNGYAFTNEEILSLLDNYPDLQSHIYRTAQGWQVEESALNTLRGKMEELESTYFNAQKQMTDILKSDVGARMEMLGIELDGITSMAEAYSALSSFRQSTPYNVNPDGSVNDNEFTESYSDKEVERVILLKGQLAELEQRLLKIGNNTDLKNGSLSASQAAEKETKKSFDWMQRAFDAMEQKRVDMQKKVDDETLSYQNQISALETLIGLDEEYIALEQRAIDTYTTRWEKAKIAVMEIFGEAEGSALLAKILNGNLTPEESTDEYSSEQAEIIQKAIDSLADLKKAEEDSAEKSGELLEHSRERYEKWTAYVTSCIDQVAERIGRAESSMELKDITGQEVTESDYKELIALSKEQVSLYYDQIDALKNQMSMVEEGSAEYYSLQSKIAGCQSAIQNAERAQAEWNEAIKEIPIKRIQRYLELLGHIKEDLNNFINEQEALGKNTTSDQYQQQIEISQQEIDKLLVQQNLLQNKLGDYRFQSDKYNETASSIQDIDNEISELIRSQHEYNKAILQIPIDRFSQMNDALNTAKDVIGDILSEYDSAIAGVTAVADKQIEELNALKDATNDKFEGQIEVYQEELSLLQKQNKERQQQLEQEQRLYDLEKANAQKSNKVIRNGETAYEADLDAVRNAQAALTEADYNKAVSDLEEHIASLEEERDALLEGYDQEIEKLNGIKERWAQIAESIKQATDILKTEEILGAGFADQILSGEDSELYESMSRLYSTILKQQTQYEDQIVSNERIAALMSQYVESWQNGSITFEQAIAAIRDISAQMQDGFTSKEHLDALLGLSDVSDLTELLGQAQANASQSLGQMEEYFHVVKSNSDAMASYVKTWDEMKQNIQDQIEALKAAAEALQSHPVSVPSSKDHEEEDDGERGPTDTYVHGQYVHTNDGWGNFFDKNTGKQIEDPTGNLADALERHKRHDGLASGPIGSEHSTRDENLMLQMVSRNLGPNEALVKAEVGEYILTAEQFQNLARNIRQLQTPQYQPREIDTSKLTARNMTASQNIEFSGNIILQGVQDPDGLAMAIKREFPMRMRQAAHKW